jgi:hypothetical protein
MATRRRVTASPTTRPTSYLYGLPILTTVREPYVEAWSLYNGGLAIELPPKIEVILQWYEVYCLDRSVKYLVTAA